MLYMIDRRPVVISALYLSICSVFVDVMFIAAVLVVFFTIMILWALIFFPIVSGSINSSSPCWCTLYTSNKCPPGISPHSGRKGIATKLTLKLKSKRKEIATKLTLKLKSKRKGLATKITPKLKRKRKGIATKLTLIVRKRKQEKITRKTRSSERAQCKNATEKTAPICS